MFEVKKGVGECNVYHITPVMCISLHQLCVSEHTSHNSQNVLQILPTTRMQLYPLPEWDINKCYPLLECDINKLYPQLECDINKFYQQLECDIKKNLPTTRMWQKQILPPTRMWHKQILPTTRMWHKQILPTTRMRHKVRKTIPCTFACQNGKPRWNTVDL